MQNVGFSRNSLDVIWVTYHGTTHEFREIFQAFVALLCLPLF
jgi:hypothetical protein